MATCPNSPVNVGSQAPDPVEWSLPFAKVKNEIADLWGFPTSPNWLLAEAEGRARAIAVLNLAVEGETHSDKARKLGHIFGKIACHQFRKRHRFDVVMAWSIDRIGRSTHEVTGIMEELDAFGVSQLYLQQGIDSSTPAGRAMVQMAIVFSEFERGIIRERIMAGLQRARKAGTKSGKAIGRPKTDPKVEAHIRTKLTQGSGLLRTAKELGVGVSVVMRIKQELGRTAT